MHILNSDLINAILDKYTEKVKFGYNKIPYNSWRTLKKLTYSNVDYIVKIEITDDSSVLYLTNTETDFTSEIHVTDGFAYLVKERTIHMVDNMNTENKSATTSASRRGFNLNLDFGPMNDGVAFSPYGLAVRNSKREFYTYNPATAQTIDVTGFTFDFKGMIYRMPVDIKVGDMIIHKHKPMFVTSIDNTNDEGSMFENMDMGKLFMLNMMTNDSNPFGNLFNFNGTAETQV